MVDEFREPEIETFASADWRLIEKPEFEGVERFRVRFLYKHDDGRRFQCDIPYAVLLDMKSQLDAYFEAAYPGEKHG